MWMLQTEMTAGVNDLPFKCQSPPVCLFSCLFHVFKSIVFVNKVSLFHPSCVVCMFCMMRHDVVLFLYGMGLFTSVALLVHCFCT